MHAYFGLVKLLFIIIIKIILFVVVVGAVAVNVIIIIIIITLRVGFESNLINSAVRKKEKYLNLIKEMSRNYRCVKFVNLSMSSLGVFSDECSTFLDMMNDIGIDKKQQHYIIKKMINIAIRATYYIFCCRNRNLDSPKLMKFRFLIRDRLLFIA